MRTAEGPSTAAGDFQITGSNWYGNKGGKGLKHRLGAKNFTPENQLRAALMLFADRDNRAGIEAIKREDWETAIKIAAKDWAAVPGSDLHKNKSGRKRDEFLRQLGVGQLNDPLDTYLNQFVPAQTEAVSAEAPRINPIKVGGNVPLEFPTQENLAKMGLIYPATTSVSEPEAANPNPVLPETMPTYLGFAPPTEDYLGQNSILTQPNSQVSQQTKSGVPSQSAQPISKSAAPVPDGEYQKYLKYTQKADSAEARSEYEKLLQTDFGTSVEVSAEVENPAENTIAQNNPNRKPLTTQQPAMTEAQTDSDILAGGAGVVKVDLARKPKGANTSRWLEGQALRQIAPQYGLTNAEIEEYLNQSRAVGGGSFYDSIDDNNLPETLKGLRDAYGDTSVEVSVRNQAINEILNRRNNGQGLNNQLRNEIDYQSNLTAQGLAQSQNNAGIYRAEEEAKRRMTARAGEGDYAAQQVASEYLGTGEFFTDLAKTGIVGQLFGGEISDKGKYVLQSLGSDVPPPSEEWVKSELDRLKSQHGDFAKAWRAEEYYQNSTNLEKFLRTSNQVSRSFVKNLFGATTKGLVFVSDLFEDTSPLNYFLPDKAKIGVRNAANGVDFAVRLLTSNSSKDAIDFFNNKWVSGDAPIDQNQFFRAAQAFDEAVGDDPVLKGRLLGSLGDAGGSALSFIVLGLLTPGLSVTTRLGEFGLSSAIAGGLQSAGTGYEEGRNAGLSEDKAKAFGVIQGLLGATEGFGIGGQIGEIVKSPAIRRSLVEGILEVAKKGAWAEGKEEFFQEVFQTTGGKIALETLKDEDPRA
ncbi:MAG TPA: hypothetical protein VF692_05840, partial [Pyrinomonadaceae bacterium]